MLRVTIYYIYYFSQPEDIEDEYDDAMQRARPIPTLQELDNDEGITDAASMEQKKRQVDTLAPEDIEPEESVAGGSRAGESGSEAASQGPPGKKARTVASVIAERRSQSGRHNPSSTGGESRSHEGSRHQEERSKEP